MTRRAEPSRLIGEPEAGFFKIRLCKGGPWVAASITRPFGQFWQATINGHSSEWHVDPAQAHNVYRIWTTGIAIPREEYEALLAKPPLSPELPIAIGTLKPTF